MGDKTYIMDYHPWTIWGKCRYCGQMSPLVLKGIGSENSAATEKAQDPRTIEAMRSQVAMQTGGVEPLEEEGTP